MNAKELVQRHPVQTGAIALSLLLLGFGVFRHMSLPDLEAEQERLTKQATLTHSNVVNSTALADHVEALKKANQTMEERMAKASDLAGNTQYFYRLETELGLREIALNPMVSKAPKVVKKGSGPAKTYSTVAFSSVVEGKFTQVLAFIEQLEGGAWFGRVSALTLRHSPNADTRGDPLLTANISVELFAKP